jgi:transcription termination/antitermination protein NusG
VCGPLWKDGKGTMQKHWYAVHTYSGHEDKVSKNILRRAESMGLQSKVSQVLVPKETETRRTQRGVREMKRKVFPGYVLVEMELNDQTWYLVKSTTGVTGFVSSGNKPVPLQDKEVQLILNSLEGTAPTPVVKFEKGEVVRVTAGPFTEFTGKIEEVNLDKEKLKVLISIFGRDTPVELDFQQVEKVI